MALRHLALTLRAVPDSPPDMPPGGLVPDVPLHPEAQQIQPQLFGMDVSRPFAAVAYVKRSEAVSFVLPLEIASAAQWLEDVFSSRGYGRIRYARSPASDSKRPGIVFHATPPERPDVTIQIALRPDDAGGTVVSYLAEQHPVPPRDPGSFLSADTQRVEVEYSFMNRSPRRIRRAVIDPRAITSLIDAINALPRDIRSMAGGTGVDGKADLWFVMQESEATHVRVDPAHHVVIVESFPGLFGDIWEVLEEVASADDRARQT